MPSCPNCKESFAKEQLRFHVQECDGAGSQSSIAYDIPPTSRPLFTPPKGTTSSKKSSIVPSPVPDIKSIRHREHDPPPQQSALPRIDLSSVARRGQGSSSKTAKGVIATPATLLKKKEATVSKHRSRPSTKSTERRPVPGLQRTSDPKQKATSSNHVKALEHRATKPDSTKTTSKPTPERENGKIERPSPPGSSYGRSLFGPPAAIVTPPRLAPPAPTLAHAASVQKRWDPTQIIEQPAGSYQEETPKTVRKRRHVQAAGTRVQSRGLSSHGRGKALEGSEAGNILVEDTPPQPPHSKRAPKGPSPVLRNRANDTRTDVQPKDYHSPVEYEGESGASDKEPHSSDCEPENDTLRSAEDTIERQGIQAKQRSSNDPSNLQEDDNDEEAQLNSPLGSPRSPSHDCSSPMDQDQDDDDDSLDGTSSGTGIIRSSLLNTYGLVINTEWRIFICTICGNAETTESLRPHLNGTHSLKVDAKSLARVLEIGKRYQVRSDWPDIDTSRGPIPAITGLPIKIRSACPRCDNLGTHANVKKHIASKHAGEGRGLNPVRDIPCQVLNGGVRPRNFPVLPHPPDSSVVEMHDAMIQELQEFAPNDGSISKLPLDDQRLISPWVLRAGFYRCTEGHDISSCRNFVALPRQDERYLAKLGDVVLQLLNESSSLIDKTDPYVLQRLNTGTPETGLNHTPFHHFQQHETTIRAYALPVSHLVASLIRRGFDGFMLPTNGRVNKALAALEEGGVTVDGVHQLLLSIWTHQWTWTEENPNCDPTACFLSMFTLQKDGTFAQAKDVTGIITKLTRAIRLTVLREIHLEVSRGQERSLSDAFNKYQNFLVESSQSTFQTLQYYQHYASYLSFQTQSLPTIIYPERHLGDFTVMLFRGHRITIPQVKAVMNELEQDIMVKLKEEVLLGLDLHLAIETPVDRLQSSQRGYSFISDPGNPFLASRNRLGEAILNSPGLREKFVHKLPGCEEIVWDVRRCREWLQALADLEALLLLSVEMKSGAPMRLTELTSTLACNIESRTRNLYAFGRDILICSQYNKNTNNEQADRMIPHALATFDADVLLQVHALARPFAQFLVSKIYPDQTDLPRAYQDRLFMGHAKPITSREASEHMGRRTKKWIGISMTISEWRISAIGYKNVLCTPSEMADEDVKTFQTFQAQQSGHSLATERRIYALTPEESDKLSRTTIQIYINVSVEWQTRLGIVPSGLSLPYWKATMQQFDSLVAEGAVKLLPDRHQPGDAGNSDVAKAIQQMSVKQTENYTHVLAELAQLREEVSMLRRQSQAVLDVDPSLQSNVHSDHPLPSPVSVQPTMGSIKSDYLSPATSSTSMRPQASRTPQTNLSSSLSANRHATTTSSQLQPHSLNPPGSSSSASASTLKRKREQEPSSLAMVKRPNLSSVHVPPPRNSDMLVHLRYLYGDQAGWTHPGQRLAVEALLENKKDVIVILRTGIGKSAIALLPTIVERGITVLVIPLVVLMQDWKRRLDAMSIDYEEFDTANPEGSITGATSLILVSADKAAFPSFKAALAHVNSQTPVLRMIMDETQLWLTDREFRKDALAVPSALRTFPMQFVLLSATIPPTALPFLKTTFGMVNATVIRGSSHRPELEYDVVRGLTTRQKKAEAFKEYLQKIQDEGEWNEKSRWIAFVESIDDGEYFSEQFGVEFYQSHTPKKAQMMDSWMHGAYEGIVATSALAAGVDYPHVRLSVHLGDPYGMVLFVQQSSRAGRDGQPARCVIFSSDRPYARSAPDTKDIGGYNVMQKTIYGDPGSNGQPPCVRSQIGEFLDGKAYSCLDFDETWALCYVCDQEFSGTKDIPYTREAIPFAEPKLILPPLSPPPIVDRAVDLLRLKENFLTSVKIGQQHAASSLSQKGEEVERYAGILQAVGTQCGACLMRGEHATHGYKNCPYITQSAYRDISTKIKYEGHYQYRACWFCHVASWGSDTLHPTYSSSGQARKCPNPNFLLPVMYEVWNNPGVRAKIEARFGVKWGNDLQRYLAWLVEPDRVHSTRSMALVVWFGDTYQA